MNTWAPIWSGIVDSSLWEESGDVVKVFMTMLATKDSDHICRLDAYRIAKKCNIDELQVLDILKILASPDKRRKVRQQYDGRRIKAVEDGWLILNGQKYRDMVSEEREKARWRKAQQAKRDRDKAAKASSPNFNTNGGALPGENAAINHLNNGDENKYDNQVTSSLPEMPEIDPENTEDIPPGLQ